jgi:hypothetical protein
MALLDWQRGRTRPLVWRFPRGAAYFDIRFNTKAHSLSAA